MSRNMVSLEDNYLLFFIAAIFIPLFGFLMKMLKETANTQTRLDKFDDHIEESKERFNKISELETDTKVLKTIISRIEKDIVELFRRGTRFTKTKEDVRYDDERDER